MGGSRHVRQRVPSAFELDEGPLVFLDLLFQCPYGIEVDLLVHHRSEERVRSCGMASWVRVFTSYTMELTVCGGGGFVTGGAYERDRVRLSGDAHELQGWGKLLGQADDSSGLAVLSVAQLTDFYSVSVSYDPSPRQFLGV